VPKFASTDGPKTAIPIKNHRYQIPRYPLQGPMPLGSEPIKGSGMLVNWTRTSTILDTHKDKEGIFKWTKRLVVKGIGDRPDLYALSAATRLEDKYALSVIADQAFDYAKGQAASNLGSALHGFLERHLEGDKTLVIPEPWRADVAAVMVAFQEAGIRLRSEYQEVVVVRPDRKDGDAEGMAGRLDLLVEEYNAATDTWELVVADYKTGSDPLEYGSWEIQQQGGFYGSGWAMWDGDSWHPMPANIARDHMLMIHVLPGQASVQIHRVDIDPEELEADLDSSYRTRRRRKEAKKCHRPLVTVEDGALQLDEIIGEVDDDPRVSFSPTPSSTTPDAALQAHKARERLAKVDQMAKAQGRNDDPDDGEPDRAHEDRAATFQGEPTVIHNGEGKPLQPLAGPGQNGCSVCGRRGHRRGGKACLGENDPRWNDPNTLTAKPKATEAAPHTHGTEGWSRNPLDGLWYCGTEGCSQPAALAVQDELTAAQEDAELDRYVAAQEAAREEGTFPGQVTPEELAAAQAFDTDQNKVDNGEASDAPGLVAGPGVLQGTEEPDPFDEDETLPESEQDWHQFLDRINEATTKAEIRDIRQEAMAAGVWNDDLLQAGLSRIQTFKA